MDLSLVESDQMFRITNLEQAVPPPLQYGTQEMSPQSGALPGGGCPPMMVMVERFGDPAPGFIMDPGVFDLGQGTSMSGWTDEVFTEVVTVIHNAANRVDAWRASTTIETENDLDAIVHERLKLCPSEAKNDRELQHIHEVPGEAFTAVAGDRKSPPPKKINHPIWEFCKRRQDNLYTFQSKMSRMAIK